MNRGTVGVGGGAGSAAIVPELRRRILTPGMGAVKLSKRGFHAKSPDSVQLLETIGRTFLTGYGHAVGTRSVAEAWDRLETVPRRFRGFAYEGAAMGYAILAGLGIGRNNLTAFLAGPGERHIYMAYIGVGWAFARLPRWRWRRIAPADPLLGWLLLDGYGFHQAYFRTGRYVDRREPDRRVEWPPGAPDDYAGRAVDQGIGRALWFVEGTEVTRVATRIGSFPRSRRADLWAGAGLAATYAGGVGEPELRRFWTLAQEYRPQVAQACTFAADARVHAGLVTEHTGLATSVFCGMSPQEAAGVAARARVGLPAHGPLPAYEVWRERIANRFASIGRC